MQREQEDKVESIEEFVARVGLTYAVELTGADDATWTYLVRYRIGDRELVLGYEDFDENAASQVARDALDEAASDASCIENSSNLWEWCTEYYGLEPHNPIIPDPEESYLIHHRRARDLKAFLGEEEYVNLLFGVERIYEAD